MKTLFNLMPVSKVLIILLLCVSAVTAGSLNGTVEVDIPYKEIAHHEDIDALMIIANTGADPISYLGSESGISMIPEQAVFKVFNRSVGAQIPLGLNDAGFKMHWKEIVSLPLSKIPVGGLAYTRITSVSMPIPASVPPPDSIIVEVIIGENSFLSSDIVDLPESIDLNLEALPSIAEFKWSDGPSLLFKKAFFDDEEFLVVVTPEISSARRVARIPPGYDVSVSHDSLLGRHDGFFTQKINISFSGDNYEDLVYNWARYQIVSGHPDTVPNAFMRLPLTMASAEEVLKCLEENSRKPWLKSFASISSGSGVSTNDAALFSSQDAAPKKPQPSETHGSAASESDDVKTKTQSLKVWFWVIATLLAIIVIVAVIRRK